ncbi:phosphate transporter [Anaeramoeba flamelloides]|uniref:Phosphate transporter n=1 Tax=Anaeramoeba flamelloides TaxID=1746091 RepID=A0ABQ8XQT1_9EUKA|nr:phosphate transporter [Anaeramoeba flamelloides]
MDIYLFYLVVGIIVFVLFTIGIGTNDAANSMGTAYGSMVFTLRRALLYGSICEIIGAVSIGAFVSETIQKGIVDPDFYKDDPLIYMSGMFSALFGAMVWLFIASILGIPVATTQCIIGGLLGFSIINDQGKSLQIQSIINVVLSWITSPLAGFLVAYCLTKVINHLILYPENSVKRKKRAKRFFPFFVSFTVGIMFLLFIGIIFDQLKIKKYVSYLTCLGIFVISFLISWLYLIPKLTTNFDATKIITKFQNDLDKIKDAEKAAKKENVDAKSHQELKFKDISCLEDVNQHIKLAEIVTDATKNFKQGTEEDSDRTRLLVENLSKDIETNLEDDFPSSNSDDDSDSGSELLLALGSSDTKKIQVTKTSTDHESERAKKENFIRVYQYEINKLGSTIALFLFLQKIASLILAFGHGGNDLANGVGPLAMILSIYKTESTTAKIDSNIWLMAVGGLLLAIGENLFGKRVLKTVGEKITPLTPVSGYIAQFSSSLVTIVATKIGMPISTTQILIGAITGVGAGNHGFKKGVNYKVLLKTGITWIFTLPIAAINSLLIYYIFNLIF